MIFRINSDLTVHRSLLLAAGSEYIEDSFKKSIGESNETCEPVSRIVTHILSGSSTSPDTSHVQR